MDAEEFVYDWWIKHEMGDDWAMMDVARCVSAALIQAKKEWEDNIRLAAEEESHGR